ncbi:hypothetical protein B0A48_01298 [Cryoendolithus antarcticus]|uniref:Uncharacterized protein n=1 Tax=Cryoendolithus antarcticus TaxID=1507870 RepID=A0A1V8TSY3_9PEZI|nr:hypothetical protein B0A48_01298 [Cryoendolithus antarcticus]
MSAREIELLVLKYELHMTSARLHVINQGFGPLRWPTNNPFLQLHKASTDGDATIDLTGEEHGRNPAIANRFEHANRLNRSGDGLNVIRFGTVHQLSGTKKGRGLDVEVMRVIDGHLMFYKHLDDERIRDILEAGHATLLQGMQLLVDASGGVEAWRKASHKEMSKLLQTLFNEFPLVISKIVFPYEDSSVDFDRIWQNEFDNAKWQVCLRSIFVYLAMSTWIFRIKNDNCEHMYDNWKSSMSGDNLCVLNLGEVHDLPSRETRITGRTRIGSLSDLA